MTVFSCIDAYIPNLVQLVEVMIVHIVECLFSMYEGQIFFPEGPIFLNDSRLHLLSIEQQLYVQFGVFSH